MQGLIYKEICLFFLSLEKNMLLIASGAIILILLKGGTYAAPIAAIMLSFAIGSQIIMGFASDEKTNWKKYQLTFPINEYLIIASKYLIVLYSLSISIVSSIIFYFISGFINDSFDLILLIISIAVSIIIPVIWSSICLPITYWFGFRTSQTMGMFIFIPIIFIINFFEDEPALNFTSNSISSVLISAFISAIILFGISYVISIIGYSRKK